MSRPVSSMPPLASPLVGQITNFVLRFFPILLINFFGQDLITALVNALPVQVTDILQIFSQHAAARRLHAPHAHDLQA